MEQGVTGLGKIAMNGLPSQQTSLPDVGRRLRELRTDKRLSIRALAKLSGLNVNTLSMIENGKTSPSVSTLQQVAAALGVAINAFFEVQQPVQRIVYQKASYRPKAAFDHGELADLGSGFSGNQVEPFLVNLEPKAHSGQSEIVHTGVEFVYCLEGFLDYEVDGQIYHLEAGDSLVFEAHLPHRWGNPGTCVSRSLLLLCPSDERDRPDERHFN
jgi:transcriptional regulator with XRE-family HTH domain